MPVSWCSSPAQLDLFPGDVHVFWLELDIDEDRRATLLAHLDIVERARVQRLMFERDRNSFIAAHGQMRQVLGRITGKDPSVLSFTAGPYGKPFLAGSHNLHFNLSHSGHTALLAVTVGSEIGLDIETIRPGVDLTAIGSRFFSKKEWDHLSTLSGAEQLHAFFACWTRKEAYIKGRGLGLKIPLNRFSVPVDPFVSESGARLLEPDPAQPREEDWRLYSLDVGAGYAATLAVDGPVRHIHTWIWPV